MEIAIIGVACFLSLTIITCTFLVLESRRVPSPTPESEKPLLNLKTKPQTVESTEWTVSLNLTPDDLLVPGLIAEVERQMKAGGVPDEVQKSMIKSVTQHVEEAARKQNEDSPAKIG